MEGKRKPEAIANFLYSTQQENTHNWHKDSRIALSQARIAGGDFLSKIAEAVSPNPVASPNFISMANRIQSPKSPFFLGSNDDNLERAQARAARVAAVRRKLVAAQAAQAHSNADPGLSPQQVVELYQNCIKLASENKINQKNTWELGLIDHLHEIIKVEEGIDAETNFQKASCTLEAGVKIYSLRVDSLHSEAYKVLGGINRAGHDDEQDGIVEDGNIDGEQGVGRSKKETDKKFSPLSTLESSFDALNVKKFDVAFAVDPLYHQTSAQFDEGGAKGLLLNNLGVFGGCRVLFDSREVPGKCAELNVLNNKPEFIDLTFAKEYVEQMVLNMQMVNEISPSLNQIVGQFDEDNRRPTEGISYSGGHADEMYSTDTQFGGHEFENGNDWDCNDNGGVDMEAPAEDADFGDPNIPSYTKDTEDFTFQEPNSEDKTEEVESYLFRSLGLNSNHNAWAGPDHWKYRKPKGSEEVDSTKDGSPVTTKKPRSKKKAEADLDFTASLDKEMKDIFAPPKNSKLLLLPANRVPSNTRLPEDCHYQPEALVKLFLLPNVTCLGRKQKKNSDEQRQPSDDYDGPSTSWDDDDDDGANVYDDGPFDDGNNHSDVDEVNTLVSQPRQVNKIEVQYDRTSKQVDVQALKDTLWDQLKASPPAEVAEEEAVSFKQILLSFPTDAAVSSANGDVSPHLCFICLLHLANEHGLTIRGCANLDDLAIHLPHRDAGASG